MIGTLHNCTGLLVNHFNFVLLQLTSGVDDNLTSSTTLLPYTRISVDTAACSSESQLL